MVVLVKNHHEGPMMQPYQSTSSTAVNALITRWLLVQVPAGAAFVPLNEALKTEVLAVKCSAVYTN